MRHHPALVAAVVLLAACGARHDAPPERTPASPSVQPTLLGATIEPVPAPAATVASPALRTVFVIVLENAAWSALKQDAHAPYLTSLLETAASADEYTSPHNKGHSLPNYIWLEAGSNLGIVTNVKPAASHLDTDLHLTRLLDDAGIPWKGYLQGISGEVCPLRSVGKYAVKHDPFVYFDDVTGGRHADDAACIAHLRPYTDLADDLRTEATTPRYAFIVPDLCHDMHDPCAPLRDRVAQGDAWLKGAVETIQASAAYQAGGAIFITWDESDGRPAPIGMIVVSPFAKPGYANDLAYDHSSTLKTVQEILGVTPLLGHAGDAATRDLSDLFTTFP